MPRLSRSWLRTRFWPRTRPLLSGHRTGEGRDPSADFIGMHSSPGGHAAAGDRGGRADLGCGDRNTVDVARQIGPTDRRQRQPRSPSPAASSVRSWARLRAMLAEGILAVASSRPRCRRIPTDRWQCSRGQRTLGRRSGRFRGGCRRKAGTSRAPVVPVIDKMVGLNVVAGRPVLVLRLRRRQTNRLRSGLAQTWGADIDPLTIDYEANRRSDAVRRGAGPPCAA